MRFDKLVHKLPKLYRIKMTVIIKSKHFIYKLLGIYENCMEIESTYNKKREDALQQFFKNKRVLDIGCGRGEFLNILMEKYGCECVGLDISKEMIYYAKQNNSTHEYIIGSVDFIPFTDNAVDIVHFHNVFHHLPLNIQEKTLKESKRVAKEVIMINDNVNWEGGLKKSLANIFWKITDGGYIYRTETEWMKFLKDENILDCSIGKYLMRHCYFVVKANNDEQEVFR